MFKMVLVDDKKDIVQGIMEAVDWKGKGVDITCFYNGKDALEHILEEETHMVITDIRMPFMSGLELVKEASMACPDIRFIVLTGYDEFEYAKEAIHLGVVEYLLKPISIEIIEELVDKEIVRLQKAIKEQKEHVDIRIKFNQSRPILKNNWFQSFLSRYKKVSKKELIDKFNELEISLEAECFMAAIIERDQNEHIQSFSEENDNKLMLYAIENITREVVGEVYRCEVFQNSEGRLILLINYDNQKNNIVNHYELYSLLKTVQKNVNGLFGINISIGMGECYEEVEGIFASYHQAAEILAQKFYFGNNSIISILDIPKEESKKKLTYPKELEDDIIHAVEQGESKKVKEKIEAYFQALHKMNYILPTNMKEDMFKFILKISNKCSTHQNLNVIELFDGFKSQKTLNDMEEWILNYTTFLIEQMDSENTNIKKDILKVKEYIDNHYAEAITLKKMADYIFISQSYLSFTFKEIIKVNFNEYLTKVRIEKAKEFLRDTEYRVYEVCEMVGYSDKKYFADLFKKHTGKLPSEWAKKESGNEGKPTTL